jgi:hypothetical protein
MNIKKKIARYTLLAFYFSIPFSSALFRISILILCCILLFDIVEIAIQRIHAENISISPITYKQKIVYLPVILLGWILLSKIWTTAPQSLYAYEAWRYEKLLMIPVLTYLQIQYCRNNYRQLIMAFLCGVIILMLPTYLDFLGIFNLFGYDGKSFANESYIHMTDQGRNLVYFRNQIVHGYMASIFCAVLFIMYIYDKKKNIWYLVGIFFGIFSILFLIKGRMALIGLAGSHIVLLLFSNINKKKKILILVGTVFLGVILTISSRTIQARLESIYEEAFNYFINSDSSTSGGIRLHYWAISWNLFIQHPLLGAGGGAFREFLIQSKDPLVSQNHYHTHSEYMTMLSLYGAVGMGIFLRLIREIYTGLRQIDCPEIRYSVFAATTIFLINSLTDSSLNNQWEGWSFVLFTSFVATNLVLKESTREYL